MRRRFEVRQAGKEHIPLLRRWRNASRREHGMVERQDEHIDIKNHYIAFEGESPIGFYNITRPSKGGGYYDKEGGPRMLNGHWLDLMYVPPEHRGRRVSSALLDHLDKMFTNTPGMRAVVTHPMRGEVGVERLKRRGWAELGNYRGHTDAKGYFKPKTPDEPMLLMSKDYSKKS